MNKKLLSYIGILLCLNAGISQAQSKLVSVNPVTGTANVNIPLYVLSKGQVSFPVSLSYSATGIKPRDVESSAGMGWQIAAGGQISRVVRGLPDDMTVDSANATRKGWLHSNTASVISSWTIANTNNYCPNEVTDVSFINESFYFNYDTEPDVFYVSAPGLSCSFVFDGSQNIQLLSYQDLKITYAHNSGTGVLANAITSFTITNDQGIKYVFSSPDLCTQYSVLFHSALLNYFGNAFYQYENGVAYYNNWHLTSMTDPNGSGFALTYTNGIQRSSADSVHLYYSGTGGDTSSYQPYCMEQTTTPQLLSSVYTVDNSPSLDNNDYAADFVGYNAIQTYESSEVDGIQVDHININDPAYGPLYIQPNNMGLMATNLNTVNSVTNINAVFFVMDVPGTDDLNYRFNAYMTIVWETSSGGIIPIGSFQWGYQVTNGAATNSPVIYLNNNTPPSNTSIVNKWDNLP